MVHGFGVSAECRSIGTIGKKQRTVARSRGLVIQPQNSQLVHILSFHSQAMVSLFLFPTGPIALDSEPHGRRYVKNTGHNRNRLYSRAIHCPASIEKHYVQWFFLKSVQDITVGEKKLDFVFLSLCGPSHGAWVWCLGRVPKHRNHWQEVEGSGNKQRACYLAPKTLSWCIF